MITLIKIKQGKSRKFGDEAERIENDPVYCYAKTELKSGTNLKGTGFSFTLGDGNDFECMAESFDASKPKEEII